jgi:hypothetical protein
MFYSQPLLFVSHAYIYIYIYILQCVVKLFIIWVAAHVTDTQLRPSDKLGIFKTAEFIHPFLSTTQNYLLFFELKPISTIPVRIAGVYKDTCSRQCRHNESIRTILIGFQPCDRTQRNPGVHSETRCLVNMWNSSPRPLHSAITLSRLSVYLYTYCTYLLTNIPTHPPFHWLPTYRSIYLLSIHPSINVSI